jgi:hypothetical protein
MRTATALVVLLAATNAHAQPEIFTHRPQPNIYSAVFTGYPGRIGVEYYWHIENGIHSIEVDAGQEFYHFGKGRFEFTLLDHPQRITHIVDYQAEFTGRLEPIFYFYNPDGSRDDYGYYPRHHVYEYIDEETIRISIPAEGRSVTLHNPRPVPEPSTGLLVMIAAALPCRSRRV